MMLLFVTLLSLSPLPAETTENEQYLVSELEILKLADGDTVQVFGHFSSWVGDCLTLRGSETCFHVANDRKFEAIRSFDSRDSPIVVTVRCDMKSDAKYSVVDVQVGRPTSEYFALRVSKIASLPLLRQVAFLTWSMNHAMATENADLVTLSTDELFAAMRRAANSKKQETTIGIESLLRLGAEQYAAREDWQQSVIRIAQQHSSPTLHTLLNELGFVQDRDQWTTKQSFLAELEMVELGSRQFTIERGILEVELDKWRQSGRHAALLRALTSQQYALYANRGELKSGMRREEVVRAWGFPDRVTWVKRLDRYCEAWFQDSQWVCFINGMAFSWSK